MAEFANLAAMNSMAGRDSIKLFHDVKAADTGYDNLITAHIPAVLAFIQAYCGHDFESKTRTENPYVLPNERHFYVNFYPIASITSLVEVGLSLTQNVDFYADLSAGRVEKIDIPMNVLNPDRFTSAYWSIVRASITITYVGGVALDDSLIAVIKELVGVRAGIKKRTWTDNEGVERVSTINTLSPMYQEILDQYRRRKVRHIQSF